MACSPCGIPAWIATRRSVSVSQYPRRHVEPDILSLLSGDGPIRFFFFSLLAPPLLAGERDRGEVRKRVTARNHRWPRTDVGTAAMCCIERPYYGRETAKVLSAVS